MKKIILLIIEKIRKAIKVDEKGNSFGWRKGMLLLAVLLMVGCKYKTNTEIEEQNRLNGFNIVVVDSCEYLYKKIPAGYAGYGFMAHKGNCRFCKERRQKELKELVIKLRQLYTIRP
jgi:hypothetical protein